MLKSLHEELTAQPSSAPAPASRDTRLPLLRLHRPPRPAARARIPPRRRFLSRTRLNKPGSEKETWHIEFDLAGSGIDYTVGDAFGIFPANDPALADAVIAALGAPPDFPIGGRTLREVLIDGVSLSPRPTCCSSCSPTSPAASGGRRPRRSPTARTRTATPRRSTCWRRSQKFSGVRPDPEAFIEALDPLQPRLYSIASSPKVDPQRIALTVDAVRYTIKDRDAPRRRLDLPRRAREARRQR